MGEADLSRSDVGQWAVVTCVIAENRRLTDCAILEQSTPDTQVGQAILELTDRYRARSTDASGRSVIGRRVELAMAYGGTRIP